MTFEEQTAKHIEAAKKVEYSLWKIGHELEKIRMHLIALVMVAWLMFAVVLGWFLGRVL